MPVSSRDNWLPIAAELGRLWPGGVCELGIGSGMIGAIARHMLDIGHGRVQPSTWRCTIHGVEGFPGYRNPLWDLYNRVSIDDVRVIYKQIENWPLVMMIDCLEHIDRPEAEVILDQLIQNNGHVIISVPIGEFPQEELYGNELERHLSTWTGAEEFARYRHTVLHESLCCVVSIEGARKHRFEYVQPVR